MSEVKKSSQKNTLMAAIAYILFFVPLLTEAKDDAFVKFHVKQGLVLLLVSVGLQFVGGIIPVVGWFLILPMAGIFTFVLFVMGIINAVNGEEKELPLIGQFASNFKF